MRNSGRRKKKTIQGLAVITVIIAAAAVAGGVFLWKQAEKNRSMDRVLERRRRGARQSMRLLNITGRPTDITSHLSNYLFMGIDTTAEHKYLRNHSRTPDSRIRFFWFPWTGTEEIKVLLIPRDTITEIEVFNPSGQSLGTSENHIQYPVRLRRR